MQLLFYNGVMEKENKGTEPNKVGYIKYKVNRSQLGRQKREDEKLISKKTYYVSFRVYDYLTAILRDYLLVFAKNSCRIGNAL